MIFRKATLEFLEYRTLFNQCLQRIGYEYHITYHSWVDLVGFEPTTSAMP